MTPSVAPSLADVVAALAPAEKKALRDVARFGPHRRSGGWGNIMNHTVTLAMSRRLTAKGLARVDHAGAQPRLVQTGLGAQVLAVLDEGARRRA